MALWRAGSDEVDDEPTDGNTCCAASSSSSRCRAAGIASNNNQPCQTRFRSPLRPNGRERVMSKREMTNYSSNMEQDYLLPLVAGRALTKTTTATNKARRTAARRQPATQMTLLTVFASILLVAIPSLHQVTCQHQSRQQSGSSGSSSSNAQSRRLPDLTSATSTEPIVAVVGSDAFVSCVAKNLQNYTIIWRYTNDANAPAASNGLDNNSSISDSSSASQSDAELNGGVILTAGRQRVTSDDRFSVLQSHNTWLLKISNVKMSDTGTYVCNTNSQPRVRALRILSVIKPSSSPTGDTEEARPYHFGSINYDFTECCRNEFVGIRCQRLCTFQQLSSRYQSINIVHECYSQLPSIARCMVGGRNLTDCCNKRHVPSRCHSMCGHTSDGTTSMSVQDQTYCNDYSASIMSCVAEGVSTLPGQPELVIVEAVSSSTLKVSWQKVSDESELRKIDGYIINLTKLSSFADTISTTATNGGGNDQSPSTSGGQLSAGASSTSDGRVTPTTTNAPATIFTTSPNIVDVMNNSSLMAMTKLLANATNTTTMSLQISKQMNEFSIDNLKPYTVYQIQMYAYNSYGRSQLTDPIRALTLAPENESASSDSSSSIDSTSGGNTDAYVEPSLPDTRKCCIDRGVTLKRCLDTLCDPVEADKATIADLMICAPWSNVTFSCLSSRVNHTECCKTRGVSTFCLSMCSGDVKRVDYRHFRCLTHMSTYTNCILESHNVLPSSPQNFTVGPITHTWAVLNWRAPKKHARSLQGYRIFWRRVDPVPNTISGQSNTSLATTNPQPTTKPQLPGGNVGPLGDILSFNDDVYYSSAEAATNPYLLDALQPGTVYETFVVAVNKFGQSETSVRFIFQTLPDPEEVQQSRQQSDNKPISDISARLPLHGNTKQDSSEQQYYNETMCCINGGVHNGCQQLCDYDLKVSDVSNLITNCNTQMPVILRCLAGSRNSVPCCRSRGVSDQCLNVCAGLTEHSPLVVATRCASDFGNIIRCMDEGTKQIPGAPVDFHTVDIERDRVTLKWSPANEDKLRTDIQYHIRYQQLQSLSSSPPAAGGNTDTNNGGVNLDDPTSLIAVVPLHPLEHNLMITTNNTEITIDKLKPNTRYSVYVTAENRYGISLPSLVLVLQTPSENLSDSSKLEEYKRKATLGAPHSLEILRSDTESIVLKWGAPLFINNDAHIKYRVFYKLLGPQNITSIAKESTSPEPPTPSPSDDSSVTTTPAPVQPLQNTNWTVAETSDTTILLRNLLYSSQYAITVQAYSKQLLGHMSEILIASTAKPIPPTLNHPLIINSPIEGNNITIMCVALGQPTPQISMFINGLLVQKRTQPYVIYHLVNLVRGHLTITCFASNGHGKDYASVQSRTDVSVKFPSKATAKAKLVRASPMSTARLTCEVTGNPQPTVVWTFTPASSSSSSLTNKATVDQNNDNDSNNSNSVDTSIKPSAKVVQANDRITTLLLSQFENPFTWSHTLTIRNVSQADIGTYQCRSKNLLADSSDMIQLTSIDGSNRLSGGDASTGSSSSTPGQFANLTQLEQTSDLMECCKSQNVSAKCLPACSVDGLDVETAFKTAECQQYLDKLMFCAADGSDHRNCCRNRQVPITCLRWCSGAKYNIIPAFCFLSAAIDINQCFQEGRTLLPGPPRNVRVMLASDSDHDDQDMDSNPEVATMTSMTNSMFNDKAMMSIMINQPSSGGSNGEMTAGQGGHGDSALSGGGAGNPNSIETPISPMAVAKLVNHMNDISHSTSGEVDQRQDANNTSEQQQQQSFVIEWDPPSKNPHLVQYYRIFWRPFGSRDVSRTVTNGTWIKLNNLNMNKMYEFVLKAANQHGSSVYSDPLTVKPAEIVARSSSISSGVLAWFMPSSGAPSLMGRVLSAICFATLLMFSSLAVVVLLERRGYLKRFASSKSNGSRISFANPAYSKDSDGSNSANGHDGDNITWDTGHSLDILAPPPITPTSNQSVA